MPFDALSAMTWAPRLRSSPSLITAPAAPAVRVMASPIPAAAAARRSGRVKRLSGGESVGFPSWSIFESVQCNISVDSNS